MSPIELTDTLSERSAPPTIDTSDDPTGASIVWGFLILLIHVALGLGFVLAR